MKHLLKLFVLSITLVSLGCGSANKTTNSATGNKQKLSGYWILDRVSADQAAGKLRITVFDDAVSSCFEGSRWMLMPNGKGSYNISSTAAGCNAGERNIFWSTSGEGNNTFQLKKLMEGEKAKQVDTGYKMNIESSSDTEFTLSTPVAVDGKTVYVRYHFSKDASR